MEKDIATHPPCSPGNGYRRRGGRLEVNIGTQQTLPLATCSPLGINQTRKAWRTYLRVSSHSSNETPRARLSFVEEPTISNDLSKLYSIATATTFSSRVCRLRILKTVLLQH